MYELSQDRQKRIIGEIEEESNIYKIKITAGQDKTSFEMRATPDEISFLTRFSRMVNNHRTWAADPKLTFFKSSKVRGRR